MNRRDDLHPTWCGRGHVCSHTMPAGEHRSYPLSVDTELGRLVATRIQTRSGRGRLELRAVVNLSTDPVEAARTARLVLLRVQRAIRPVEVGRSAP